MDAAAGQHLRVSLDAIPHHGVHDDLIRHVAGFDEDLKHADLDIVDRIAQWAGVVVPILCSNQRDVVGQHGRIAERLLDGNDLDVRVHRDQAVVDVLLVVLENLIRLHALGVAQDGLHRVIDRIERQVVSDLELHFLDAPALAGSEVLAQEQIALVDLSDQVRALGYDLGRKQRGPEIAFELGAERDSQVSERDADVQRRRIESHERGSKMQKPRSDAAQLAQRAGALGLCPKRC